MVVFGVLSGPLPKLGVLAVALLAGLILIAQKDRVRAWAMLGALALAPVLLLDDIWNSPQLRLLHRHPLIAVVLLGIALVAIAVVAWIFHRWPALIAFAVLITLPFRIPLNAGGTTSNLLVPLYFVVAAAALSWLVPVLLLREGAVERRPPAHRFEQFLALYVAVYAIQSFYSSDFEKALQNMVFFYVPFTIALALLRDLDWSQTLIRRCAVLLAGLAVIFAGVGFIERATHTVFLNSKLIAQNDLHPYFTVNSVFFDPDIFGRFLALVMILVVAVLIYDRRRNVILGSAGVLAVLWGGLVLTLSRSSLAALLVGMAILAAMRWQATRKVLGVGVVLVCLGGLVVAITPRTFGLNQGLNNASSGRTNLISGGIDMFGSRPVWGYGSGAFTTEYTRRNPTSSSTVSASHTIAITIAAEQGLIGLLPYIALVLSAILLLVRGARGDPVRAGIAAAFVALMLHTELYADFLEDPVTWALLGVGGALATRWADAQELTRRARRQSARGSTATA